MLKIYNLETSEIIGTQNIENFVDNFNHDEANRFLSMHYARMKKKNYVRTNKTKVISEISGTTAKPWKQKGTGNARQGSLRSAQFRGGGVAFGPRGVNRFVKLPKNECFLAKLYLLQSAMINSKLGLIENPNIDASKTKISKNIFSKFNVKKVLIVHNNEITTKTILTTRNLKNAQYVSYEKLTAHDLISVDLILITNATLNILI